MTKTLINHTFAPATELICLPALFKKIVKVSRNGGRGGVSGCVWLLLNFKYVNFLNK